MIFVDQFLSIFKGFSTLFEIPLLPVSYQQNKRQGVSSGVENISKYLLAEFRSQERAGVRQCKMHSPFLRCGPGLISRLRSTLVVVIFVLKILFWVLRFSVRFKKHVVKILPRIRCTLFNLGYATVKTQFIHDFLFSVLLF